MSRAKLYFQDDDQEECHTLEWHRQDLAATEHDEEKERVLYEAKRVTGEEFFYCKEFFVIGMKGECGLMCEGYKPNNGKNGRCAHWGYCYEPTEKTITIHR